MLYGVLGLSKKPLSFVCATLAVVGILMIFLAQFVFVSTVESEELLLNRCPMWTRVTVLTVNGSSYVPYCVCGDGVPRKLLITLGAELANGTASDIDVWITDYSYRNSFKDFYYEHIHIVGRGEIEFYLPSPHGCYCLVIDNTYSKEPKTVDLAIGSLCSRKVVSQEPNYPMLIIGFIMFLAGTIALGAASPETEEAEKATGSNSKEMG